MKSIFGLSLLLSLALINAGDTDTEESEESTTCYYEVTVVDAKDLDDMDPDLLIFYENKNDVYVEIYGYGTGGDDKMKVLRTTIKEGEDEPSWSDEQYVFDNDEDTNGDYIKFLFKLYDDDDYTSDNYFNDPDFLGEAGPIFTSAIESCDAIYSEELTVMREEKEAGTMFVEITKSAACCESGGSGSTGDDEEKEEKVKGKKGRRLLA